MVSLNDLGLQAPFTPQRILEIPRTLGTWLFPVPGSANDRKPTTTSSKKEEEEEEEEKSATYFFPLCKYRNPLYIKDVNREKNGNAWWIFVALKPTHHKLYIILQWTNARNPNLPPTWKFPKESHHHSINRPSLLGRTFQGWNSEERHGRPKDATGQAWQVTPSTCCLSFFLFALLVGDCHSIAWFFLDTLSWLIFWIKNDLISRRKWYERGPNTSLYGPLKPTYTWYLLEWNIILGTYLVSNSQSLYSYLTCSLNSLLGSNYPTCPDHHFLFFKWTVSLPWSVCQSILKLETFGCARSLHTNPQKKQTIQRQLNNFQRIVSDLSFWF